MLCLIVLITIFYYYHISSHIVDIQVVTFHESAALEFSPDNSEIVIDHPSKHTFLSILSVVTVFASSIIAITFLSYFLIRFLRNLALLTPVLYQSKNMTVSPLTH